MIEQQNVEHAAVLQNIGGNRLNVVGGIHRIIHLEILDVRINLPPLLLCKPAGRLVRAIPPHQIARNGEVAAIPDLRNQHQTMSVQSFRHRVDIGRIRPGRSMNRIKP